METPMRHVMLTFVDPDDAAAYYALPAEEQQADVERHIEWFRRHRDHVVGGEELGEPVHVKTLRPGRQEEGVVVTDGPYVDTKEILGGFIVLETETADEAIAIASEWPALASQPNATVQLHPVFVRE
jgi:hypothetical protein